MLRGRQRTAGRRRREWRAGGARQWRRKARRRRWGQDAWVAAPPARIRPQEMGEVRGGARRA